jgi:phage gpG-like protein
MASFAEHKKILKQIEAFKPQLNKMVEAAGVLAVNHFTKSFSDGGFTDESLERWKPRKRSERGKSRAILVKSGRLRRSLRSRRLGNLAVKIMTDVPYARVHNNGEGRMPKRQFIGYSGKLNRQIIAFLDKNIKKQFNK